MESPARETADGRVIRLCTRTGCHVSASLPIFRAGRKAIALHARASSLRLRRDLASRSVRHLTEPQAVLSSRMSRITISIKTTSIKRFLEPTYVNRFYLPSRKADRSALAHTVNCKCKKLNRAARQEEENTALVLFFRRCRLECPFVDMPTERPDCIISNKTLAAQNRLLSFNSKTCCGRALKFEKKLVSSGGRSVNASTRR